MTVSSLLRFCLVLLTLLTKLHAAAQIANRYVPHASFPLRLEAEGGDIYAIAVNPAGDVYVGGAFATVSGQLHRGLARYRADGSLDASFNTQLGFDATVAAIALQPDGRVLVGGNFISYDGQPRYSIARLNVDGSLDTSFGPTGVFDGAIYSIAIQSNGAVVVGGDFNSIGSTRRLFVARLKANGQIDETFDPGYWLQTTFNGMAIYAVAIQPDGRILAGGSLLGGGSCVRFSARGAHDTSFAPDFGTLIKAVHAIVVQPDGKILAGGAFRGPGPRITRLNVDGSTDTTFNAGKGLDYNANFYYLSSLALQPDGKIVAGGYFDAFNETTADGLIRLNADGSVDSSFATTAPTNALVSGVALLPGGRIAVSRSFNPHDSFWRAAYPPLARLSGTGATEFDYGVTTRIQGIVNSASMLPGGKVVLGGYFDHVNGVAARNLARLNGDGSVDTTFTPAGADFYEVTKIAPLADGRMVVAGRWSFANVMGRLRILQPDGTMDSSFGDRDLSPGRGAVAGSPAVRTIAVQPDGKLLIGGEFSAYNGIRGSIARVSMDGQGEPSFAPVSPVDPFDRGFNGPVYSVTPQNDGKIIVGGTFTTYGGVARHNLARLNADGSLDASFTPGTGFFNFDTALSTTVRGIMQQSDGRYIVAGNFDHYQGKTATSLMRISPEGAWESTFAGGVLSAVAMLGQPDGKALIGGAVTDAQGQMVIGLIRVTGDGKRDTSFTTPGLGSDYIRELTHGPNGELIVAGGAAQGNGVLQTGLAILAPTTDATVPTITTQPQSQTINVGSSVTFSVSASGDPAPTYQWLKGSTTISGATTSSYSITNAQLTDAGSYSVTVANSAGAVASNAATLIVNNSTVPPPAGGGGGGGGGAPSIVWLIGTAVLFLSRATFTRR